MYYIYTIHFSNKLKISTILRLFLFGINLTHFIIDHCQIQDMLRYPSKWIFVRQFPAQFCVVNRLRKTVSSSSPGTMLVENNNYTVVGVPRRRISTLEK